MCQTTTQALALLIKVVCPLSIASKGLYIGNQSANMASDTIWSFGYGSNMDVVAMEAKKSVKVLGEYCFSVIIDMSYTQSVL